MRKCRSADSLCSFFGLMYTICGGRQYIRCLFVSLSLDIYPILLNRFHNFTHIFRLYETHHNVWQIYLMILPFDNFSQFKRTLNHTAGASWWKSHLILIINLHSYDCKSIWLHYFIQQKGACKFGTQSKINVPRSMLLCLFDFFGKNQTPSFKFRSRCGCFSSECRLKVNLQ